MRLRTFVASASILCLGILPASAQQFRRAADQLAQTKPRCIVYEVYLKADSEDAAEIRSRIQSYVAGKQGLKVQIYDMNQAGPHKQRLETLSEYFKLESPPVPAVFALNYLAYGWDSAETLQDSLELMRTMHVYVRTGCPKCAAAKRFLPKLQTAVPAIRIVQHDVVTDPKALGDLEKTAKRYRQQATSLPAFHFCNSMSIGFNGEEISGKAIMKRLLRWTVDCPTAKTSSFPGNAPGGRPLDRRIHQDTAERAIAGFAPGCGCDPDADLSDSGTRRDEQPALLSADVSDSDDSEPDSSEQDNLPLPPLNDEGSGVPDLPVPGTETGLPPPPLPGENGDFPMPDNGGLTEEKETETVDLSLIGEVSLSRLGMPAFTVVIGLIDGFNPCAMWVLMFLLSLLVNLKDRARILAVAGSFVIISGVAYFAFMAAWLNIFQLIGYLRAVQLTLGCLAVIVGCIHVKDFFAFKQGVSLSIPESAKPGIYARARGIIMAENLFGAILGAVILAVLVNIIELLCTAGLPALYTNILMQQNLPIWKNYAYLGLYNVAYMFDDALMVGIVVITMDKFRLQERGGRWLKLVSGLAILVLGAIMIMRPELLG